MEFEMEWFHDQANVLELAEFIDSELNGFDNPAHVIKYFEKPYTWETDFQAYEFWKTLGEEVRGEFLEEYVDGTDLGLLKSQMGGG